MSVRANPAAMDAAKTEAARRVARAAVYVQQYHQQRLSISNPRPYETSSKPGEYPRKRTGALVGAIVTDSLKNSDIIGRGIKAKIGVLKSALYGLILEEKKQRLGFKRTAEDTRKFVKAILEAKVKK